MVASLAGERDPSGVVFRGFPPLLSRYLDPQGVCFLAFEGEHLLWGRPEVSSSSDTGSEGAPVEGLFVRKPGRKKHFLLRWVVELVIFKCVFFFF